LLNDLSKTSYEDNTFGENRNQLYNAKKTSIL